MTHVDIYTDGACKGNPGPGGWAAILLCNHHSKIISGCDPDTTNNKMELQAVISGLAALTRPCEVTIYTDSQYISNAINLGWLNHWKSGGWHTASGKHVKNVEYWKSLLELLDIHQVEFVWVKGHAGNVYNEQCDTIAVAESQKAAAAQQTFLPTDFSDLL